MGRCNILSMDTESWYANELVWRPFHVPGVWGVLLNVFGVGYGIVVFAFSFCPTAVYPDAVYMTWSCLITGTIMLGAVVYYCAVAKKVYQGPVVEITLC